MKSQRIIYSLSCPFTNEIHYIGKTTQGMTRPLSHITNSHSEKVREWVSELKFIGHAPVIGILEYVPLDEDLDEKERWWIQRELNKNSLLLNSCLVTPLLISSDLDKILGDGKDMEHIKIATFIKERRKKAGLNQYEFSQKSGVALTVVRKIEQGKTNLNFVSVLQMLKMFGCTIDVVKINNNKY